MRASRLACGEDRQGAISNCALMDYIGELIKQAVQLRRLENGAAARATDELTRAYQSILAEIDFPDEIKRATSLGRFYNQVERRLPVVFKKAEAVARQSAFDIGRFQSERIADSLSLATRTPEGITRFATSIRVSRVAEILENDSFQGFTAGDWWAHNQRRLSQRIGQQVSIGVAAGENAQQLRERLATYAFGPSRRQAESLTRTVTANVANASIWETGEANPHLTRGYRLLVTFDRNTSKVCMAWGARNQIYPYAPTSPRPPFHFQCFPAGTVVAAPKVVGSTTRWYTGEVIEIETLFGHKLTVTPNHPILTSKGWIAAGLIDEGDYVVSSRDAESLVRLVDPDDHHVPALIEEIAESLGGASGVITTSVPVTPVDFHSDGEGSEVSIVRANSLLRDGFNAAFGKPGLEDSFGLGHPDPKRSLTGQSRIAESLEGAFQSARSDIGGSGISSMFFGSPGSHHHSIGSGYITGFDSIGEQSGTYNDFAHSKVSSDAIDAFAREVHSDDLRFGQSAFGSTYGADLLGSYSVALFERSKEAALFQRISEPSVSNAKTPGSSLYGVSRHIRFDRVLKVRVASFSGHVYNLETKSGWYVANGVIAHNCRTLIAPVPITRESEKPEDAGEWLTNQSEEVQNEILGKTRAELFRQGRINLVDLIRGDNTIATIPELRGVASMIQSPFSIPPLLPPAPPPGPPQMPPAIRARKRLEKINQAVTARSRTIEGQIKGLYGDMAQAFATGANDQFKALTDQHEKLVKERARLEGRKLELMRNALRVNTPSKFEVHKAGKFDPSRNRIIDDGAKEFAELIGRPLPQSARIVFKKGGRGRAHYNLKGEISVTTASTTRTIAHELGHWLEDLDPAIHAKVVEFYERRTAGEQLVGLGKGYARSEKTRRDNFINPYMGKEYVSKGKRYATEILSMGVEYLHSDPYTLAMKDPDYFDFIFEVVRGL